MLPHPHPVIALAVVDRKLICILREAGQVQSGELLGDLLLEAYPAEAAVLSCLASDRSKTSYFI